MGLYGQNNYSIMQKSFLILLMALVGFGVANAKRWTVKMETSIETRWLNTEDYQEILDKGAKAGPTRSLTVDAENKSEAMSKAKSMCYDACDGDWVSAGMTQQNGKTYRVQQRIKLTNYYVVD